MTNLIFLKLNLIKKLLYQSIKIYFILLMQNYSYKTISQLEKSINEYNILDDIKYVNIYNNNKNIIDSFLEKSNLKVKIFNEQIFIENNDNILTPLKLKKNIQKFMNLFDIKDKNISFIDILNSSYFLNDCDGLPCSILLNLELSKVKEDNIKLNNNLKDLYNDYENVKLSYVQDKVKIIELTERINNLENIMKKYESTKIMHTLEIPKVPELYKSKVPELYKSKVPELYKPKPNPYDKDYYFHK
jgi:hypothetical protein